MSWFSVEVRPAPDRRDAVAAWLVGRTGQAIEERDDGTLISFAADLPAVQALESELGQAFGSVAVQHREQADVDWSTAWREGIKTHRVGRVTVAPSWLATDAPPGQLTVVVDPEMAFGSGDHGSTRAALALIEQRIRPGDRVVDLGTGSGILAIAAVLLGAGRAIGIEVDGDAVPVAVENAERNGTADRVVILEGEAAQMLPLVGPAEMVVSNILRLVNVALLPDVAAALVPGGTAIFSGMEAREAESFRDALTGAGYRIESEVTDAGWWAVAAVLA